TILNDDNRITIGGVSLAEGNSGQASFVFTVSLSQAAAFAIRVQYATANGTAAAGTDYVALALSTLTFNPGETQKTITVKVNGDTVVEPDETFFVNLSGATNATIATAQGTGTIRNDDAAGSVPRWGRLVLSSTPARDDLGLMALDSVLEDLGGAPGRNT